MTSYVTPKKNTAYKFYAALVDQSNTKLTKANPTIASGDFKVSTDGGAFSNLATLPSANPASGRAIMIDLSAGEMNGDNIVVQCVDAAGAEWCDLVVNIQTSARQIDDLAFPVTSGRGLVVDGAGLADANTVKVGPTGSGTAQTARDIGASVVAASVTGNVGGNVTGSVGSVVGAVGSVTGAVGSVTAAVTAGTVSDKTGYALTSGERNSIADALLDRANAVETGWTLRMVLRILAAALGGKVSGAATTTVVIRDITDAKDRITATVDASGNRSAVTLDGS